MKRICKTFAVLLVMAIALFSFSITAGATEVSNTQDGLVASITSEKDSYKSNEDIELTFKVTNTNDFAVENVSLEAIIPDGLKLKSKNDTSINTVSLTSGESLELTLTAVKESSVITVPIGDSTEPITESPTQTQPVATETTENTTVVQTDSIQATTVKANSATSDNTAIKTGNNMSYILAGLICLVCLVVAVISFKFRKKTVKYLSLVLCVCISVGSFAFVGVTNTKAQETAEVKTYESKQIISLETVKFITVDNKEYRIETVVKYTAPIGKQNDEFIPSRDSDRYVNDDLYTTNPDKSHKVIDKDTGVQFVDNELLIYVKDNTTQENIEELCKKFNAYIVGKNKTLSSYKLRFKDSYSYSELKLIMNKIQQEEMINESSLNLVIHYDTNEYYPTSKKDRWTNDWNSIPSGANWGVEAIKTPQAWEYMDLMQEVNVGVYDQGFDTNHEDLKNVIKTSSLYPANPTDHGTHVTGTIGADFENGIGINGVCPTAHFSLYNYNENNSDSDSFNYAMTYLIDKNKCKVINMSLGPGAEYMFAASKGELSAQKYLKDISADVEKVLKELVKSNDFVICKSAGNSRGYSYYKSDKAPYGYYLAGDEGTYLDRESGNYLKWNGKSPISGSNQSMADWDYLSLISDEEIKEHIIVVGAIQNESDTTAKYSLCSFSDIGDVVDVVAPGYDIESSLPDNDYNKYSGTSMASPHVAGIAAMLYSLNPNLTGDKVKRIICETATTKVDGYKLVDAEAAAKKVLGQGSLSGEVLSLDNNTGLSNVRVDAYLKLKSGKKFVDNTYTNDKGNFSMELQGGSYELKFNKDGYKTATTTIKISKDVMTVLKDPIIMEMENDSKIYSSDVIQKYGEDVYYCSSYGSPEIMNLPRLDFSDTGLGYKELPVSIDGGVQSFIIYGGYIYYMGGYKNNANSQGVYSAGNLYRCDLNGDDNIIIANNVTNLCFQIINSKLYYNTLGNTSSEIIYNSYDLKTENNTIVNNYESVGVFKLGWLFRFDEQSGQYMEFDGGYYYYENDYSGNVETINGEHANVYYYRKDIETGEIQKIGYSFSQVI